MRHLDFTALALLCVALTVVPAAAQDKAAAETLFQQGIEKVKTNPREALDLFQRSMKLDPSVGAALNIAYCLEQIGKITSAWATYKEAEGMAAQRGDAKRQKQAMEAAAKLFPKLPKLTIVVEPSARVPGLSLTRNGLPVGAEGWGVALPVDPEPAVIEASAPGYRPSTTRVDGLVPGAALSVTIAPLEAIPQAPENAKLAIVIPAELGTDDAAIAIDGRAIPRTHWGQIQVVAPGDHMVTASARCRESFRVQVTLAGGAQRSIEIPELARTPSALGCAVAPGPASSAPPSSVPPVTAPPAPREGGLSAGQKAGLAISGVGLISGIVGGVMMFKGQTELSSLANERDRKLSTHSAQEREQILSDFETSAKPKRSLYSAGSVTLILGGVAVVGGGVMAFLSPGKETASLRLLPAVGSREGGLWLSGRW